MSPYLDWHTPKGLKSEGNTPQLPLPMYAQDSYYKGSMQSGACKAVGTVCKGSAHWKLTSFGPLFMMHKFKPTEFHAICCWDKILSLQQNFFAKMGVSHKELILQHVVSTTSPLACVENLHLYTEIQ